MDQERIFIVFDTETTGKVVKSGSVLKTPTSILNRGSEVLQIGGIVLNNNMVPIKMFCHCCDTVIADSDSSAREVHNIDIKEIRRYVCGQFLPEIMTRYLPEFFYSNVCFIGYNVMFDMTMIAQSLANSPIPWTYKPIRTSIVPRKGRWCVDVAEYVKTVNGYRRLSSFEKDLTQDRRAFINMWESRINIETNCVEVLKNDWNRAHNAFFDSVNTYLLWGDRIWKKKVL